MQRRVEQPDRGGQPVHDGQQLDEVGPLQWQERIEGGLLRFVGVGENHPLDEHPAVAEEHVLRAAKADSLGTEVASPRGVVAVVGVGAHPQTPDPIGMA